MDVFEGYEREREMIFLVDCPVCYRQVPFNEVHFCKKLEDMPIGVPFVVSNAAGDVGAPYGIRLNVDEWTWMFEECGSIQELYTFHNRDWSGKVFIADWFEECEQPSQTKNCSCDIVLLMQGGCKCGGK